MDGKVAELRVAGSEPICYQPSSMTTTGRSVQPLEVSLRQITVASLGAYSSGFLTGAFGFAGPSLLNRRWVSCYSSLYTPLFGCNVHRLRMSGVGNRFVSVFERRLIPGFETAEASRAAFAACLVIQQLRPNASQISSSFYPSHSSYFLKRAILQSANIPIV
jgi:hypothetical protein